MERLHYVFTVFTLVIFAVVIGVFYVLGKRFSFALILHVGKSLAFSY
jgi:hypothetical protein